MDVSLMKLRLIKEKPKRYQLDDRSREILILPGRYKSDTSKIFKKSVRHHNKCGHFFYV